MVARAEWPICHAFATPTKRDGFLATNSLLATLVLLVRAYELWAGSRRLLPATLDDRDIVTYAPPFSLYE